MRVLWFGAALAALVIAMALLFLALILNRFVARRQAHTPARKRKP